MGLALWLALVPAASGQDREAQRERFQEGWAAAGRADQAGALSAIRDLDDYPLRPYLEFELLRQRLDQVPEAVMEQFLARYREWSFAGSLERRWLRELARSGKYPALRRQARNSEDPIVLCHLARADLDSGRLDGLADRASVLWVVGESQPDDCNPLFDWWRRNNHLTAEHAWQRFLLAIDAGNEGLARYLRRYLDADQDYWAQRWLQLKERPGPTLSQARQWIDHEQARLMISATLRRLAGSDWERARDRWQQLDTRFSWSPDERAEIDARIALFQAVDMEVDAIAAIDALPSSHRSQQLLEWRARVGMAHERWPVVLESIEAMNLRDQARGRWRYWRGRALAALQRPDALLAYASLSAEASYYGFLAAKAMGQDLRVCNEDLAVDPAIQRRLLRDARFERALELDRVGLDWHARWTWIRVSRQMTREELHQAALLAADQDWHDRVISALGNAGTLSAYTLRFPLLARQQVLSEASNRGVDPALVYGLMRAESAMQADAISSAGARGLLQLMPGTAQAVARRNSLPYGGRADLLRPVVNIPLGVAHLAELQDQYDGRWIHVAAAYNAGAGAVNRWLDSRPMTDSDVWLETLPFFETRDYVPRVLAFATLYEWHLGRQPAVLADHVRESAAATPPVFSCTP
ncbi:MAG: transglycosylase SLT domain-containing protein [Pseudomonadota bacterium]